MKNRPDLEEFEPGSLYVHVYTGQTVEYLGQAFMTELDGEDVGVFRFIDPTGEELRADLHKDWGEDAARDAPGGFLIATRAGWNSGETFEPMGEAIAEEIEDEPR